MKTTNLIIACWFFLAASAIASKRGQQTCHWNGEYRQTNGDHDLKITCEIDDLISFQITHAHNSEPIANFLAVVHGDSARMIQPYPDPGCQITLKRLKNSILVLSRCGEPSNDNGLYHPQG